MDLLIPWVLSYTIDDIVPLGDVKLIFVWGGVMFLCAVTALCYKCHSEQDGFKGRTGRHRSYPT